MESNVVGSGYDLKIWSVLDSNYHMESNEVGSSYNLKVTDEVVALLLESHLGYWYGMCTLRTYQELKGADAVVAL